MATSSNWKRPVIAIAVVVTLSLGVLAASLVALAGNSNSPSVINVTTVTSAEAAITPPTATTTGAPIETTRTATISPVKPQAPTTSTPARKISPRERLKLEALERSSPSPAEKRRLLELEQR